ncbi:MAG TPA: hypothetical protein VGP82_06780, partial [Ktedonobacterales bacterium]|nr:hypothetical protein [Ktedonobacterales bacterium]
LRESPDAHLDLTLMQGSSIEEDLALRDFRLNALALPLSARGLFLGRLQRDCEPLPRLPSQLVDPFAGLDDLRSRRLDVVSDAVFRDDPGRILRGARLAAHLGLAATPATMTLAREAAAQLADLPDDRIREELNLLLALPRAANGFALLYDMQALEVLVAAAESGPNLPPDVAWAHMIRSLSALSLLQTTDRQKHDAIYARLPLERLRAWYAASAPGESIARIIALGWATVLHALAPHEPGYADAAPGRSVRQPQPAGVATLRGLPARVQRVLHAWHDAQALISAEHPDEGALRRLFDNVEPGGESALDALMVAFICLWARSGSGPDGSERDLERVTDNVERIVTTYFDDPNELMPPRLLDGAQVIRELGVTQGPIVGRILRAVRAEQLAGNVSTVDEALAFACKHM